MRFSPRNREVFDKSKNNREKFRRKKESEVKNKSLQSKDNNTSRNTREQLWLQKELDVRI